MTVSALFSFCPISTLNLYQKSNFKITQHQLPATLKPQSNLKLTNVNGLVSDGDQLPFWYYFVKILYFK